MLDVLRGCPGATPASDGPAFLSQLLFYSASISASKLVPSTGYRYALRVNPSSGNLHPTEFHFVTRGLKDWPDGLYHYRPSSHMAEQRALGDFEMPDSSAPITFVLTSIAWREAWKYRQRAYRYCLHDIGHAWQALALAARAIGCDAFSIGQFPDDDVAQLFRIQEDEWPMLMVELRGASIPLCEPDAGEITWYGGQANQLSSETIVYPEIDAIHQATKLGTLPSPVDPAPTGSGGPCCPRPLHPHVLSAKWSGCGVPRSTLWVECSRYRRRSSRPFLPPRASRCLPILGPRVSSSFICTFIASAA